MRRAKSGFVTSGRNHSAGKHVERNVSVPANHAVVVSIREPSHVLSYVTLYIYFNYCNHDTKFELKRTRVWGRRSNKESDFAQNIFPAVSFLVSAFLPEPCTNTGCFKLFFTFFHENQRPLILANSLWNCSARNYPMFQHHLACNLKTECEDGQDEAGHCPYSSAECDGMIAMCGSCFKLVDSLRGFVSTKSNLNERANEFCNSIQAWQMFPSCVHNSYAMIRKQTKVHPDRLKGLWTGLYSRDTSLPKIYRHALVGSHRTIFYHFWKFLGDIFLTSKVCFQMSIGSKTLLIPQLHQRPCVTTDSYFLREGTMCEFANNLTARNHHYGNAVHKNGSTLLLSGWRAITQCSDGHVTHSFLACGFYRNKICGQLAQRSHCTFSSKSLHRKGSEKMKYDLSYVDMFTCNDNFTSISYTIVCNFVSDCLDHSDEIFCKHSVCSKMFRCNNGQCLPFERFCDNMFHCVDESDEDNCAGIRMVKPHLQLAFPSPALIMFDGIIYFISTPMKSNESCPDSHYRCPGEFNDCLPVYTRCNGVFDCVDHQDDEGCADMTCPGLFRCRLSRVCLHYDHMCDGWPHCPMYDDELVCDDTCPIQCLCQGHSFLCPQPFTAGLFPQLRHLDATGSGMTLHDVSNNSLLIDLVLAWCSLTCVPQIQLKNVQLLDLGSNQLQHVNLAFVAGLDNIRTLILSNNPLASLHTDESLVDQQSSLTVLHLAHITLTVLDTTALSQFPSLHILNLTFTSVHTISAAGFQFTPQLNELHMDNSPVQTFPLDMFKDLSSLSFISAQSYKLCCDEMLPRNFNNSACFAPKDEISSCKDLLQSWTYRGFLWLVACFSLTGNFICFCARIFAKSMASSSGFSVFVLNLTMADFLMGVYIVVIGVADEQFRGRYIYSDHSWKNSAACKVAGILSLLSSEVSVLTISLITLDRFIVLHFPFSSVRFSRLSAATVCLLNWAVGWSLALVPLLPVTSHWKFYSQTGICIPLPVTRQDFKGRFYSFGVLIVFNFLLFLCISTGQAFIYWTVQRNAMKTSSTNLSKDMTIARRLISVAVTDFLCWFPIGLCGMLVLGGVPIPGEVNVALAVFVLPVNSAINPFLYTLNTLREKMRKADEDQLHKWLESHHGLIVN